VGSNHYRVRYFRVDIGPYDLPGKTEAAAKGILGMNVEGRGIK